MTAHTSRVRPGQRQGRGGPPPLERQPITVIDALIAYTFWEIFFPPEDERPVKGRRRSTASSTDASQLPASRTGKGSTGMTITPTATAGDQGKAQL